MKIAAFVLALLLTVPFGVWIGVRVAYVISFDIQCEGHLKRAGDANTIKLAHQELESALEYVESHNLTQGSTHLMFPTPECDVTFWYDNLQSARDELEAIPAGTSQLEKTNILMKLRETLLDSGERGVSATVPPGITIFPYQWLFLLWGWFSFLFCLIAWCVFFGVLMVTD